MAESTLSTTVSRRTMLAGGAALLVLAPAAVPPVRAGGDARVVALAGAYRRAMDDLTGWIGEVERRHGPCAYDTRPECRERYHDLLAGEDRAITALAAARPDGLPGLAAKMRAACYFQEPTADCDDRLLVPALRDLERLVG